MHMKGGMEKGLPITPNLKRWTLKIDVRGIRKIFNCEGVAHRPSQPRWNVVKGPMWLDFGLILTVDDNINSCLWTTLGRSIFHCK